MRVKRRRRTAPANATRGRERVSGAGIVEKSERCLPSFFSTITPRLEESKYWQESPPQVSTHWPRGRMRRLEVIALTTGGVRRIDFWNFIGLVWFGLVWLDYWLSLNPWYRSRVVENATNAIRRFNAIISRIAIIGLVWFGLVWFGWRPSI